MKNSDYQNIEEFIKLEKGFLEYDYVDSDNIENNSEIDIDQNCNTIEINRKEINELLENEDNRYE